MVIVVINEEVYMKNFYISIFSAILFLFFSGCAQKEFVTKKYYPNFTKDEILNAGKLAFKNGGNNEYIIDSYRDKLEVTKIEIIFDTLEHKDYILNVKEDNCGTSADLKATSSYGALKGLKHNSFEFEHEEVWDRIEFFLGKKDEVLVESMKLTRYDGLGDIFVPNIVNKKVIKPTKDLSECVITDEFSAGVIKDKSDGKFNNEIK